MSVKLPVELWRIILLFLPRSDQRTCLHVCNALHDIALSYLFRRVDVFLGSWYTARDPIKLTPDALDTLYVSPNSVSDSCFRHHDSMDILSRISTDPHFAGLVKNIPLGVFYLYNPTPAVSAGMPPISLIRLCRLFTNTTCLQLSSRQSNASPRSNRSPASETANIWTKIF